MAIELIEDLIVQPLTADIIYALGEKLKPKNIFVIDNPQEGYRPIESVALFTQHYDPILRTKLADLVEPQGMRVSKVKRRHNKNRTILYAAEHYPQMSTKVPVNYTHHGEVELRTKQTTLWFMDNYSIEKYASWLPKR